MVTDQYTHLRATCAPVDAEIAAKLLSRAPAGGPDECWEWPHAKTLAGYGRQVFDGRVQFAHRLSFRAFVGPIADGENVCHRCDNPPCWNPTHLFAGSQGVNVDDRQAKGRGCKGERHHSSKLTEDQVREIRASDLSGPKLAEMYGVKFASIYKILDGRSWKHVK